MEVHPQDTEAGATNSVFSVSVDCLEEKLGLDIETWLMLIPVKRNEGKVLQQGLALAECI